MPQDPVNLLRKDGSLLQVTPQEAEILRSAGYRDETPEEQIDRSRAEAAEAYYTTGAQGALTVGEGLTSGASVGLTDLLFEAGGADTAERAKYNPGKRLASEFVGAVIPSAFSGGAGLGAVLAKTPAGMVARGAARIAPAVAEGRAAQAAVRGGIEGFVAGGGAEVTTATLNGDPLTVEGILAGAGIGTLIGSAGGALLSKVDDAAHAYAASRASKAATKGEVIASEHYAQFHGAITDARKAASTAIADAEAEVSRLSKILPDDLGPEKLARQTATDKLVNTASAEGKIGSALAREAKDDVIASMKRVARALDASDVVKAEKAIAEHAEKMSTFARITGLVAPDMEPLLAARTATSNAAVKELQSLKATTDLLGRFDATPAGFASMGKGRLEKASGAVDNFMGTKSAELEGARTALRDSISNMAEKMGVSVEGTPAAQLRGIWDAAKKSTKAAASPGIVSKAASRLGNAAMNKGVGAIAAGNSAIGQLIGLKSLVLGGIQDSIAKWAPKVTRAAAKVSPGVRVEPLRRRLDGTEEDGKRSRRELMLARAREIQKAAPTILNTLNTAVAPLAGTHPEFASAAMQTAYKQFSALVNHLPRDPGTSIVRGESTWAPDFIAMERFARVYEAFHDPVGVARRAIEKGEISPQAAAFLKEANPEIWNYMRMGMLERLSEPGVKESLDYREQIALGQLIDVPLNSTATPRFIAAQQAMYANRNKPLQASPTRPITNPSNNPSGGRPAGSTAAQAISEH